MCYLLASLVLLKALVVSAVEIDAVNCGADDDVEVTVGHVPLSMYPWLGVLYYASISAYKGEIRAVTTVALIQTEFVIAPAADVGPMPKEDFRRNSRVLLGQNWNGDERRVRSYVIHPEYGETFNTVALVQLKEPVRDLHIKPLCPPPELLRNPEFYLVKFQDDFKTLTKEVLPMEYVPGNMCKDFYVTAHLYADKMRPPHVVCAISLEDNNVCVWEAGGALVARDAWGRWQLLGLGARGPGCGAPSRYLDMMTYYPWLQASLAEYRQITISKIHNHKYVIRSGGEGSGAVGSAFMRYGACDVEEKENLIYREMISLRTNNNQYQFMTYNMTLLENVEYTCLTIELVNASAVSEFRIRHTCVRHARGPPCYMYRGSSFDISVYMMFSDTCIFEMYAWGFKKNLTLLDVQEWKWLEGTFYEDFSLTRVEYRGPTDDTLFGFESMDEKMWVPEYDYWTTTEFSNLTTTTEMPPLTDGTEDPNAAERDDYGTTSQSRYIDLMKIVVDTATPAGDSDYMLGIRWKRQLSNLSDMSFIYDKIP